MVNKQISLTDLKIAIAREKAKASTTQERAQLERELKQLRAGTSNKLLKRFGRGFAILAKKGATATGKGIVKARKFAEESGAGKGLDIELASAVPSKRMAQTTRVVKVRRRPRRRVTITKKTTTRRVRIKPARRRKVVRRVQQDNGGFFGGFSDLGI